MHHASVRDTAPSDVGEVHSSYRTSNLHRPTVQVEEEPDAENPYAWKNNLGLDEPILEQIRNAGNDAVEADVEDNDEDDDEESSGEDEVDGGQGSRGGGFYGDEQSFNAAAHDPFHRADGNGRSEDIRMQLDSADDMSPLTDIPNSPQPHTDVPLVDEETVRGIHAELKSLIASVKPPSMVRLLRLFIEVYHD